MDALTHLATQLGERLQAKQQCLALAESCTGGWLAKVITDVPGSSAWFERGLVTYSNQAKQDLLGVPTETLGTHGAVSEQTAQAMAAGVLANTPVDMALAITGIAGPDGGSADKPVGTVWFAWGKRGGDVKTSCQYFSGDREQIRAQAVAFALKSLHGVSDA
ncbi:MAG: hypothetical protein DHS20C10_05540 [marine bacterium B5-7]|nr:MAG: hypothetical protein DHS20C10_05540 [marine bacterium B5-7]